MSGLFRKPVNVSFDEIEHYVNAYDGSDDLLLFKYLYLLSKRSILNKRLNFTNRDTLDMMSSMCASEIFSMICNSDEHIFFDDMFETVIGEVMSNNSFGSNDIVMFSIKSFENYILDLYSKSFVYGRSDLHNFSEYIRLSMSRIPKKIFSSEWFDIYKSVLLSFNKTIKYYKANLFDFNVAIYPKIILYNCDKKYSEYIAGITLKLVCNLRDNLYKVLSSEHEDIFTLHFKEFLNA